MQKLQVALLFWLFFFFYQTRVKSAFMLTSRLWTLKPHDSYVTGKTAPFMVTLVGRVVAMPTILIVCRVGWMEKPYVPVALSWLLPAV